MGRSVEEAEQLLAAYRERKPSLRPLEKMLGTRGDQFTADREDRQANDAAVVAVVEDLRPLGTQTNEWMQWAAEQVRRQEEHAEGDEVSLQAALAEVEPLRDRAWALADEAVAALDVAQTAALARHMVTELTQADRLWGPDVDEKRSRDNPNPDCPNLGWFADQLAEHMRSRTKHARRVRRLQRWAGDELRRLPEPLNNPMPWGRVPRKYPLLRQWRSVSQPMQAIEAYGREIDEAHERVRYAHAEAQRAEHKAAQERRRREREEEARRQAEEAERLAKLVADFAERFEAFRREWALSSRQLRERGWTSLQKTLCDGLRDDDVLIVAGIPREQARAVLALLQLAADHGSKTGERLTGLLATEDDLLAECARLQEAVAGLPVDAEVSAKLANRHPELRGACEWLGAHLDQVIPVLAGHAPQEARTLYDAVQHIWPADNS